MTINWESEWKSFIEPKTKEAYDLWVLAVNAELLPLTGMGLYDVLDSGGNWYHDDISPRDWYYDGISPVDAAQLAIRYASSWRGGVDGARSRP